MVIGYHEAAKEFKVDFRGHVLESFLINRSLGFTSAINANPERVVVYTSRPSVRTGRKLLATAIITMIISSGPL